MFTANVIRGDDLEFSSLIFPRQNNSVMSYISNGIERLTNVVTGAGTALVESAVQAFNNYNSAAAQQRARMALMSTKPTYLQDLILPAHSIEDIRASNLYTQRWVMAQPDIRKIYHDQLCDGFSNTYMDMHPGDIGEAHYDYRRVMDGVVVDENNVLAKFYLEDLIEGDRELTTYEKFDVLSTWDIIKACIEAGEDPTSVYGSKLG